MDSAHLHHPAFAAALGAGRSVSAKATVGRVATGDITFTDQPAADDVFTINGVEFTAKANGADGNEFNIAASLTLSIDALAAVLNASTDPNVALATYSNVGGTKLHVVYDTKSADGNAFTLAETSANASVSGATLTGGAGGDAIDLKAATVALTTVAGAASDIDLPAGEEGQEVTVYLAVKGAGANAVVNGAFAGGTKVTFDTVGEYFKAKYLGASWVLMNNTGTLA